VSDHLPPPNPSLKWFRLVVWLMPTCVALTTFVALDPIASVVGGESKFWLAGWLGANILATYGLGVFDQKLSGPTLPSEQDAFAGGVGTFVGLQVILIPILLLAAGMISGWLLS